jgi:hypothetical protein
MKSAGELRYSPTFIHFFGIRRSGNHGVIHWLSEGLKGNSERSVMHVNNVADGSPRPERQPAYIRSKVRFLHPDFVILSYEDRTAAEEFSKSDGKSNATTTEH